MNAFPNELDGPAVPPHDIQSATVLPTVAEVADSVEQTLTECNNVWESIRGAVDEQIRDCLQQCATANDSCIRCVAGNIQARYPAYETTVGKCYAALGKAVAADLDTVRSLSFGLGLGPVTADDTAGGGGIDTTGLTGSTDGIVRVGGGTGIDTGIATVGGGGTAVDTGITPPVTVIGSGDTTLACLPNTWDAARIRLWMINNYGDGSIITLYPTQTSTGVGATASGAVVAIPKICPPDQPITPPPDTTITPPPQTIVTQPPSAPLPCVPVPPGYGVVPMQPCPVVPPGTVIFPPGQSIINNPSQPPATGQIINVQPPAGGNVIVNLPSQTGDSKPCTPCKTPQAVSVSGSVIADPADHAAWDQWLAALGGGLKWVSYPTAALPGLAVSDDGSTCLVASWVGIQQGTPGKPPPDQSPAAPPPGGVICSPETAAAMTERIAAYVASVEGRGDAVIRPAAALVGTIIGSAIGKLTGIEDVPVVGGLLSSFVGGILGIANSDAFRGVLLPHLGTGDCKSDGLLIASVGRATARLFGGWFGAVPPATLNSWDYIVNSVCPNTIPQQGELNTMRNQRWIEKEPWLAATKALGNCPDWQERIVESQQGRPGTAEAIMAARRQLLEPDELAELMDRNGVTDRRWQDVFYRLTEFVPGPSDIVSFMVRDVFDDAVVKKYGYDDEFNAKFAGDALKWAESQGINSDVFKYFWRAHWQIPSITQLREFVYRLRPDNRSDNDPFKSVTVTVDDIKNAIKVNDMTPFWVDPLIATSYRVATRVDIRRFYELSIIDLDDVERGYLDLGYTAEAAKNYRKFAEVDSGPKRAKRLGLPATADVVKWYVGMVINREDARFLLRQAGLDETQTELTIDTADMRVATAARSKALTAYKRRYMTGEFTDEDISKPLTDAGLDQDRIPDVIRSWRIERDAKYKGPTVAALCGWYSRGMITIEEYQRRVLNMGYPMDDALRVVQMCVVGDREKKAKEIEAAQRRAESDARAANARAKKALADLQKAKAAAAPCKPPPKPTCPVNGKA